MIYEIIYESNENKGTAPNPPCGPPQYGEKHKQNAKKIRSVYKLINIRIISLCVGIFSYFWVLYKLIHILYFIVQYVYFFTKYVT